jgi:isopenicillin N synthase-like dioxygenase
MNKNVIAKVDYHDFISGDETKRAQFIKEFGDSFANMGFAIVSNHGVTEEEKQALYQVSETFFNMPDEIKLKYHDKGNAGQRGYIPRNVETAKGRSVADLKEFYHIGQELTPEENAAVGYPNNIFPEELPALKEIGLKVYRTFEDTGRNLLKAIALYLNLDEDYFNDKIEKGNSVLRMLHYFPLENTDDIPPGAVRAGAHGDINLITLLMGANARGLQAQTLDGEWMDVNPSPNEIVINIGDMLSRHTNGLLRSTIHRVVNPVNLEELKKPRFSTPFFLHPISEMDLSCLDSCVTADKPKQFDERLRELRLK